jgi:ABC-type transport system involved in multi-copper enzyme maturation permease subunit
VSTLDPTSTHTSSTHTSRAGDGTTLGVTDLRVIRSEWVKLRTVRSTVFTLASAALTLVVLGAFFSALAGGDEGGGPASAGDSLSTSLAGMLLAPLIVGVLGVLSVSSEYASGMIRATLSAVRSRTSVLRAKSVVLAIVVFVVMGIASITAFLLGNSVYAGTGVTHSLTDPGILRSLIGGGIYAAGVAVFGVALGFLLRSAAGAIGVLVVVFFIAPLMIQLVPGSIGDWISKLLPSNAGQAVTQLTPTAGELSAWPGLGVFAAWLLAALAAAAIVLRRRDA